MRELITKELINHERINPGPWKQHPESCGTSSSFSFLLSWEKPRIQGTIPQLGRAVRSSALCVTNPEDLGGNGRGLRRFQERSWAGSQNLGSAGCVPEQERQEFIPDLMDGRREKQNAARCAGAGGCLQILFFFLLFFFSCSV